MISDIYSCPEASLYPPEEQEDTQPRCRCCGEPNKLIYKAGSTIIGCEHCIIALRTDEARYINCPSCSSEAEIVYMDYHSGQVVGCDNCVKLEDAE